VPRSAANCWRIYAMASQDKQPILILRVKTEIKSTNYPAGFLAGHKASEDVVQSLTLRIPGSTANLGPAFDTMALGLRLHTWLQFTVLKQQQDSLPLVTRHGKLAEELPVNETNLVYQVLSKLWRADADMLARTRIAVYTEIPTGRGLGSSASAIVGAAYAACKLSGKEVQANDLLLDCTQFEGHIDNLSASLFGGLVISHFESQQESNTSAQPKANIITNKVPWPKQWRPIACVPPYALSTEKARAAIPQDLPKADVVHNLQRVSLLTAAIYQADDDLLRESLHDKLHEPYRLKLVPELGELRALLAESPILGCVLSGAGSSVLVLVHEKNKPQVLATLEDWAQRKAEHPTILDLEVDTEGLTAIN
jgi:homoserine kinase